LDSASHRTDLQFSWRESDDPSQISTLPFDPRYYGHRFSGNRVHGNDLWISSVDRVETTQIRAAGGYQVPSQFSGHRRFCYRYGIAVLRLQKEMDILFGEN